ncbi:MAG: GDP-mannose 4,6-dehydratase [candidate division Zixibacteria bacterium]|nr:GDP-mannose 4,6-dehydratase [candidate division Zixibacteria bacterium]
MSSKSKIVITGIAGFAGSYLAENLLSHGHSVYGLLAPQEKLTNIIQIENQITMERLNLAHRTKVHNYLKKVNPEYIFHLAARASVHKSIREERPTYNVNIFGSLNILEAAAFLGNRLKRLVLISSADVYGIFYPKAKTLKETEPLNPISPYGISKAAMEYIANYYRRQYGIPVVIVRSFNHTGPRQSATFVVPSFCKQIAAIEAGRVKSQIAVGNLSRERDLSDVRDVVEGYRLAALKGKPGEVYHLCSGRTVSLKRVLNELLKMSDLKIKIILDENRLRKSDIPILKGDNRKAIRELGWHGRYDLKTTLKDALDYWREKMGNRFQRGKK